MEDFGARLKELRKDRGLTQEQLAGRLAVAFQTVSKWENGVANPDFSLIAPLAEALQVSTDELLGADRKAQRKDLEKEFMAVPQRNWQEGVAVLDRALKAFPEDYRFSWLKAHAYLYACRHDPEIIEKSEKRTRLLLECECLLTHCLKDPKTERRMGTLCCLVDTLMMLSKKNEAIALAMTEKGENRDKILRSCLEGEELKKHNQKMVDEKLRALFEALVLCKTPEAFDLAGAIIDAFYPRRGIGYYEWQENVFVREYKYWLSEGRYDEAEQAYANLCAATNKKMELFYAKEEPFSPERWYSHPAMDMLVNDADSYKCFNPYMMTAAMGTLMPPIHQPFLKREGMQALAVDMEEKRRKWEELYGEYEPR